MNSTLNLFEAEPTAPKESPPDPKLWQADLLDLLAGLEHLRGGLAGRRLSADGAAVLGVFEQMLQQTEALAGRTRFADDAGDAQTEAVGRAGAFLTALAGLRPASRGLVASVLGGRSRGPLPAAAVRECANAGFEAVNAYFALFTDRFQSSRAARGWVDAASSFLADLKSDVRDLAE
jgi:hypothetical protein